MNKKSNQLDLNTIGKRLRAIRKKEGCTQDEMAQRLSEKSEVTRQMICNMEGDKRMPQIDELIALATQLKVDLNWLILGEKSEKYTLTLSEREVDVLTNLLHRVKRC